MAFTTLFYPLIWLLNAATNGLLRLGGMRVEPGKEAGVPHTADELRDLLEQSIEAAPSRAATPRSSPARSTSATSRSARS